ncbi:unnamed protein product, partial [Adineta steineri]
FLGNDFTTGTPSIGSPTHKLQKILFEIDIDLVHSPELILADVSKFSAFPDKCEMLFINSLGNTFCITEKTYSDEHSVWKIRIISASEVAQFRQECEIYIHTRLLYTNGLLLYGNFTADTCCDYTEAMKCYQRLFRVLPTDDERRPNIYYHLGRVYRLMSKDKQAIEYFRRAQLLQRRSLPQTKYDYACTLSGLGLLYSEMRDSTKAVSLHILALAVFRTLFPEDHVEMRELQNRLAYVLWQNGQYQRALEVLNRMYSLIKGTWHENFVHQAPLFHILGLVQKALGNRAEALDNFKRALEMRDQWTEKNNPHTARTCYELSLIYAEQNDQHAIALHYAQRALSIRKAKVPPIPNELQQSVELVERLSQSN